MPGNIMTLPRAIGLGRSFHVVCIPLIVNSINLCSFNWSCLIIRDFELSSVQTCD